MKMVLDMICTSSGYVFVWSWKQLCGVCIRVKKAHISNQKITGKIAYYNFLEYQKGFVIFRQLYYTEISTIMKRKVASWRWIRKNGGYL